MPGRSFNQGVPGSIPRRLTKSFGYFRGRLVAQPGTMVAYRWRAVFTLHLPVLVAKVTVE